VAHEASLSLISEQLTSMQTSPENTRPDQVEARHSDAEEGGADEAGAPNSEPQPASEPETRLGTSAKKGALDVSWLTTGWCSRTRAYPRKCRCRNCCSAPTKRDRSPMQPLPWRGITTIAVLDPKIMDGCGLAGDVRRLRRQGDCRVSKEINGFLPRFHVKHSGRRRTGGERIVIAGAAGAGQVAPYGSGAVN